MVGFECVSLTPFRVVALSMKSWDFLQQKIPPSMGQMDARQKAYFYTMSHNLKNTSRAQTKGKKNKQGKKKGKAKKNPRPKGGFSKSRQSAPAAASYNLSRGAGTSSTTSSFMFEGVLATLSYDTGVGGFQVTSWNLNPGLSDFADAAIVASIYDEYCILALEVEVVARCPTSTEGYTNLAVAMDPTNPDPTDDTAFMQYAGAKDLPSWGNATIRYSKQQLHQNGDWLFCRETYPGESLINYDVGKLFVASSGQTTSQPYAKLLYRMKVAFRNKKLPVVRRPIGVTLSMFNAMDQTVASGGGPHTVLLENLTQGTLADVSNGLGLELGDPLDDYVTLPPGVYKIHVDAAFSGATTTGSVFLWLSINGSTALGGNGTAWDNVVTTSSANVSFCTVLSIKETASVALLASFSATTGYTIDLSGVNTRMIVEKMPTGGLGRNGQEQILSLAATRRAKVAKEAKDSKGIETVAPTEGEEEEDYDVVDDGASAPAPRKAGGQGPDNRLAGVPSPVKLRREHSHFSR